MTMRKIVSRWPGRCAVCGEKIEAGESIWFDSDAPKGKGATHERCHGEAPLETAPPKPIDNPKLPALKYNASKSDFRNFESVTEYCALQAVEPNADYFNGTYCNTTRGREWFGADCDNVEDVAKLVGSGWPEGTKRLDELSEGYIASRSATDIKRRLTWAEDGDEVDIHRIHSGDLDHAWASKRRRQRYAPPVITIGAIIGGMWKRTPEQLFWRGAAVVKLADMLQSAGYNVEIVGAYGSHGLMDLSDEKSVFAHIITIKESSSPLDLNSVSATLCFSGFQRYMGFKGLSSFTKRVSTGFGNYGNDALQQKVCEFGVKMFREGSIVMVETSIYDKKTADAWISKVIDQINNETTHENQA